VVVINLIECCHPSNRLLLWLLGFWFFIQANCRISDTIGDGLLRVVGDCFVGGLVTTSTTRYLLDLGSL
jgi:hypothetical protein